MVKIRGVPFYLQLDRVMSFGLNAGFRSMFDVHEQCSKKTFYDSCSCIDTNEITMPLCAATYIL